MSSNVVKRGSVVYLKAQDEWYQYDETHLPIGSGAMGIVYLGFHCVSHQRVAIKMVRPEYADIPAIRQRAKQESSMMFMHKNLIEMLGYCELTPDHGPIWIVSKYVQGVTIDKYLASFPRQISRCALICRMFLPVLDALHYLHTSPVPILHLDIKPSNIMVEGGTNVRLMDLGIASAEAGFRGGSKGMMGTPNYAAPEQFDLSSNQLDERTDIYEAGVTLYELLTGMNPYRAGSLKETINLHKELRLPSNPAITSRVFDVLRTATSPDKESRYQNILEFRSALVTAINTPATPTTSWTKYLIYIILGVLIVASLIVIILLLK